MRNIFLNKLVEASIDYELLKFFKNDEEIKVRSISSYKLPKLNKIFMTGGSIKDIKSGTSKRLIERALAILKESSK